MSDLLDRADLEFHKSLGFARAGEFASAAEAFQNAVEAWPNYGPSHTILGAALASLGRHYDAIQAFDRAIAVDPDDPAPQFQKGLSLVADQDLEMAIACLLKAIELNPGLGEVGISVGWAAIQHACARGSPGTAFARARNFVAASFSLIEPLPVPASRHQRSRLIARRPRLRRAALDLRHGVMRLFLPAMLLLLAACAASSANEPSLARRPAEAIDPRLPISSPAVSGTVAPAIAMRLGQLMAIGNEGARSFDAALPNAEALASAAGPAQSESWIAAQEALSALEGARAKTTSALAEVDSIAATRIQIGGGLAPADQSAIEAASNELGAVAERQNATIDRLGAQLGAR